MRRPFARLAASLAVLAFAAGGKAGEISAGVATVDITPPRGYRMAGYFSERLNTGTRDPLQAKAIVFRQGETRAALVFCDLVSVSRDLATRAREEASRRTGIPASVICVAATHSHTGPLYDGVLRAKFHGRAVAGGGKDDKEAVDYPKLLVDKVAGAVVAALKEDAAVRISAGAAAGPNVAFNRRFHMKDGAVRFNPGVLNPDIVRAAGPIDPQVGILLLRPAEGGDPFAGLTVFALHLDTVGGTDYSADYPFYLEDELRKHFGPGFLSLFGNGPCGDVNHIDVSRRDQPRTEAIGRALARAVLAQAKPLAPLKRPELAVASATIDVPLQRPTPEEVARARKAVETFEETHLPFLETVRAVKIVDLADNYPGLTERLEVQVFRLGEEVALVTLPGEVFVEHGLAIKRDSPFRWTFVIELANGSPAYIPTRKAFAEGSYEVVNSRVAPGGGEMLVETALRLLSRVKQRP